MDSSDSFDLYIVGLQNSDVKRENKARRLTVWLSGLYQLQLKGFLGKVTRYIISFFIPVPASVKQAENKSPVEGDNVQVYCNATGIPNATVFWRKVKNNFVVSKESLLNITNISRAQAGEYRCTANNTCGNASTMVNIDVQCKPIIIVYGIIYVIMVTFVEQNTI